MVAPFVVVPCPVVDEAVVPIVPIIDVPPKYYSFLKKSNNFPSVEELPLTVVDPTEVAVPTLSVVPMLPVVLLLVLVLVS